MLKRIRHDAEASEIYEALVRRDASLKSLLSIAEALVSGLASHNCLNRRWAAIEVVRHEKKIITARSKLQVAKLDLLIAQQLSAAHIQTISYQAHQDALKTLNNCFAVLCEKLSYSSTIVTQLRHQSPGISSGYAPEVNQAVSLSGTRSLDSRHENQSSQRVQNTIEYTDVVERNMDRTMHFVGAEIRFPKQYRRLVSQSSKVTRTILGQIHRTNTTFQILRPTSDLNLGTLDDEGELQIENTFREMLSLAGIEEKLFIQDQITSFDDGWTVDSLSRVFEEPPQKLIVNGYYCRICRWHVYMGNHRDKEAPWHRRLTRIKNGIDLKSPLTEAETKHQENWESFMAFWKLEMCSICYAKGPHSRAKGQGS